MTWVWLSLAILIVVLAGLAVRLWTRRGVQERAIETLHWIENSLSGHGHVTGIHWTGENSFEVPVRLSSQVFRKPKFLVSMSEPKWKGSAEPESLTFLADLDLRPAFALEMHTMRWFARSRQDLQATERGWTFQANTPVVLTTQLEWREELMDTISAVLASAQRNDIHLAVQMKSPHFTASMPLVNLHPESDGTQDIFKLIQQVAETASKS